MEICVDVHMFLVQVAKNFILIFGCFSRTMICPTKYVFSTEKSGVKCHWSFGCQNRENGGVAIKNRFAPHQIYGVDKLVKQEVK